MFMTLFRKECAQTAKSLIYWLYVACLVLFFNSQLGNMHILAPPQEGQENYLDYGYKTDISEQEIMKTGAGSLVWSYYYDNYVTYPVGYAKSVSLDEEEKEEIGDIIYSLTGMKPEEIEELLRRALRDERGFGTQEIEISDELLRAIAVFADGDARRALSTLEMAVLNGVPDGDKTRITDETIEQCTSKKSLLYDKKGEEHYNLISALHKSMRNSDPDAAVYWLARMLEAGEDPLYIARRVTRFASEDIGLADPRALEIAVAAYQACHFIGMPECSVHLTQAIVYLSMAPKSNSLYMAYERAKKDALNMLAEPVPLVIRNAPTRLMKELDYGKGYQYAHNTEDKLTSMQCLPDSLLGKEYYLPTEEGVEGKIKTRLQEIKDWKKSHR